MSLPFAAGGKRPGEPWRESLLPSSRAGRFDPGDFAFTLPCPECDEPRHVDAAGVHGAMIVVVDMCRHCGDVSGERTQAAAVAQAWRITSAAGRLDGPA